MGILCILDLMKLNQLKPYFNKTHSVNKATDVEFPKIKEKNNKKLMDPRPATKYIYCLYISIFSTSEESTL